jgi:hypothetical protein
MITLCRLGQKGEDQQRYPTSRVAGGTNSDPLRWVYWSTTEETAADETPELAPIDCLVLPPTPTLPLFLLKNFRHSWILSALNPTLAPTMIYNLKLELERHPFLTGMGNRKSSSPTYHDKRLGEERKRLCSQGDICVSEGWGNHKISAQKQTNSSHHSHQTWANHWHQFITAAVAPLHGCSR